MNDKTRQIWLILIKTLISSLEYHQPAYQRYSQAYVSFCVNTKKKKKQLLIKTNVGTRILPLFCMQESTLKPELIHIIELMAYSSSNAIWNGNANRNVTEIRLIS